MDGWNHLPFLIAHRGCSATFPENTLVAFEAALDAGSEVLECDVQMSRDGVPIVMHDPRLDRTTSGSGAVRDLAWDQIRELDAGYTARFGASFAAQRVPRLEELFDLAKGRASVFVEIKPEALADAGGRVEASVVAAARNIRSVTYAILLS